MKITKELLISLKNEAIKRKIDHLRDKHADLIDKLLEKMEREARRGNCYRFANLDEYPKEMFEVFEYDGFKVIYPYYPGYKLVEIHF